MFDSGVVLEHMNEKKKEKAEQLFSKFKLYFFKKGETILHPHQSLKRAFYLKKGFVREYTISSQGIELTIHIFSPGSYFPMTWVISDIENKYYFEAITDSEIFFCPKDKVLGILKKNPDLLYDLTKRLLFGLDKLTMRIEYLVFAQAYAKVVSTLLYLVRHFGKQTGQSVTLKCRFTHREIAALSGISRETTSRTWEMLKKRKIITLRNQLITVPNLHMLQSELEK